MKLTPFNPPIIYGNNITSHIKIQSPVFIGKNMNTFTCVVVNAPLQSPTTQGKHIFIDRQNSQSGFLQSHIGMEK